jgi:hypothetical protein
MTRLQFTLMHTAVFCGNATAVRTLLSETSFDISSVDFEGNSVLDLALKRIRYTDQVLEFWDNIPLDKEQNEFSMTNSTMSILFMLLNAGYELAKYSGMLIRQSKEEGSVCFFIKSPGQTLTRIVVLSINLVESNTTTTSRGSSSAGATTLPGTGINAVNPWDLNSAPNTAAASLARLHLVVNIDSEERRQERQRYQTLLEHTDRREKLRWTTEKRKVDQTLAKIHDLKGSREYYRNHFEPDPGSRRQCTTGHAHSNLADPQPLPPWLDSRYLLGV